MMTKAFNPPPELMYKVCRLRFWDFLGSPAVKTAFPLHRAQVQSPVREIRSYMPLGLVKLINKGRILITTQHHTQELGVNMA